MSPDFEQLLQVIRVAAREHETVHVVLASGKDFRFLEVTPQLREELQGALQDGYLALGLLVWEISDVSFQARKMFFRWHEAPELGELFDRICDAGVDSVGRKLRDRLGEDEP